MVPSVKDLAFWATALPIVLAQTSSDCNPLKGCTPSNPALSSSTYSIDFTQGHDQWTAATGSNITYGSQGAQFTITTDTDAPTLSSDFFVQFGRVEVVMKAAPGTGIVSSFVLESSDLDEIDWEFLGGDTTQAQTNFFGKGDTSTYDRGAYHTVSTPQDTWHTYSVDWTAARTQWAIDGTVVRTLNYGDSSAKSGAEYPQTPMQVKLGNWAGGGPNQPAGTVQWAGGSTDFSKGPFTMYVKSVSITNNNPGSSYTYTDESGSYESIEVISGSSNSTSTSSTSSSSTSATSATTSSPSSSLVASTAGSGSGSRLSSSSSSSTGSSTSTSTSSWGRATETVTTDCASHTAKASKTHPASSGRSASGSTRPASSGFTSRASVSLPAVTSQSPSTTVRTASSTTSAVKYTGAAATVGGSTFGAVLGIVVAVGMI